jgi:hypothetical protein
MLIIRMPLILCIAERLLKHYGDLGGQLHMVEVKRQGSNGLGLSLAGNRDLSTMSVFVVGIQPESPVATDGRIRVGDELLEVSSGKISALPGFVYTFISLTMCSMFQ